MPKIVNKNYKKFMTTGLMDIITIPAFNTMINTINLKKSHFKDLSEARAFLILLYYSGARPVELMDLTSDSMEKSTQGHLKIVLPTAKRGKTRLIMVRNDSKSLTMVKHAEELTKYWEKHKPIPEKLLFHNLRYLSKNPVKWKENKNSIIIKKRTYFRTTKRAYYYVQKWMGIPPYYFRHNRASYMADKGASISEISQWRGTKNNSTERYIQFTEGRVTKIAKYQDG